MAKAKKLQERGEIFFPVTHEDIVLDDNGVSVGEKINNINDNLIDCINAVDFNGEANIEFNKVSLSIEAYSNYAEGNDYSKVIEYIMNNVVDETKRTIINFQSGKNYIINAKINKRNVTLTGNANIIGKLEVGLDDLNQNDTNNPWYDSMMHCIIDGLSFIPTMYFPDYWKYDNHGIWLYNARSVTIRNCYFSNLKYPIYLKRNKTNKFVNQHTHRVRIINCTFMCVSYNLYGEEYNIERNPEAYLEYGDIDFQGNMCEETKVSNICLGAIDGFTCFNNTFFTEKETAEGNINLYYSLGISINNNKLFEPGKASINIYKPQDIIINGNLIFDSGYRDNSPAIQIESGCWFEGDTGISAIISDNIFRNCKGSAIKLINNYNEYGCSDYIISSNYLYLNNTGYKPIDVNGYSQGVVISNNISNLPINVKSAQFAIANNNAQSNNTGCYGNSNTWTQWISTPGDVNVNIQYPGAHQYLVDTTGDQTTINVNTPDENAKLLIKAFTNLTITSNIGNTTIKNNDFIVTKDKNDITLEAGEVALFTYVNSRFHQIN